MLKIQQLTSKDFQERGKGGLYGREDEMDIATLTKKVNEIIDAINSFYTPEPYQDTDVHDMLGSKIE